MAEEDRCFFGLLDIKTGTWMIAILDAAYTVFSIGLICIQFITEDKNIGARFAVFVIMMIWVLCIILLIHALRKDKATLMLPHLVCRIFLFVLLAIGGVLIVFQGFGLQHAYAVIFTLLVMLFLLNIEWRCYNYLRAVGYSGISGTTRPVLPQ